MLELLKRIRTLLLETAKTMLCGILCVFIVLPIATCLCLLTKSNAGLTIFAIIGIYLGGVLWREEILPFIKELYEDLKTKENNEGD